MFFKILFFKILFLAISILYSIYLFNYAKWEKTSNQNKIGSFFIKSFVLLNIAIIITSFFKRIYYIS